MTPARSLAAICLVLGLVSPNPVVAHGGSEPLIHVPTQGIQPGQAFELSGVDLGPGASVEVAITARNQSFPIATVVADADGHFSQTLTLPAGVPEGYAQLHAESDAGLDAFTWVLVGQNTSGAVNPSTASGNEWWSDPSVVVLGAMLGATLVAVMFLAFRSRRPARALAVESRARPLPRKGAAGARRRSRSRSH